jgi:hypothetical protein
MRGSAHSLEYQPYPATAWQRRPWYSQKINDFGAQEEPVILPSVVSRAQASAARERKLMFIRAQ